MTKVWIAPLTLSIEDAVQELYNEGWPVALTVTQDQAPGYLKNRATFNVPWERGYLGRYGLLEDEKITCPNLTSIHFDLAGVDPLWKGNVVVGPGEHGTRVGYWLGDEYTYFVGSEGKIDWNKIAHPGFFRLPNADYLTKVRWDLVSGINIGPELAHWQMRQITPSPKMQLAVKNDKRVDRWKCKSWEESLIVCGHYHMDVYVDVYQYLKTRLDQLLENV